MGLKRLLWRSTRIGRTIDTVKNIREAGGVGAGLKRTIKEDFTEDNPITAPIYRWGHYDGKNEDYDEASERYRAKLLEQAEKFLNQLKDVQQERDEYEKLLNDYEHEIEKLQEKVYKTERENQWLNLLQIEKQKLRTM